MNLFIDGTMSHRSSPVDWDGRRIRASLDEFAVGQARLRNRVRSFEPMCIQRHPIRCDSAQRLCGCIMRPPVRLMVAPFSPSLRPLVAILVDARGEMGQRGQNGAADKNAIFK